MKELANKPFCDRHCKIISSRSLHGVGGHYTMENLLNVTNQILEQMANKQTAYKLK